MIVGLIRPTGGKIFFKGKDVSAKPMFQRARMGMGYLAQEPSIFRNLTVSDNIMAILETRNLSSRQCKQRMGELMEDLGISGLANQKAFTLSGGERRRLEIARALVTEPAMILLDEPFSGVDPLAVYDVQEIIKSLRKRGLGILITDHSVRETLAIVDRAYLICEGRVLREGPREFLINDEVSRELYLGPRFSM
jgi:lipopolysaccharide export system ATP-binding protein